MPTGSWRRMRALARVAVVTAVALVAAQAAQAGAIADGSAGQAGSQGTTTQLLGDAVDGLQATGGAGNHLRLSWTNPSPAPDSIVVEWSTTGFPTVQSGTNSKTLVPPAAEVEFAGLTNHRTYYFSVWANYGTMASPAAHITAAPYVCPKIASAMDAADLYEKRWMTCSGARANDAHNSLNTILPRLGPEQALMTTGDRLIANPPSDGDLEGANNGAGYRGAYDASVIKIDVNVPPTANCIRFDYVFASEGYPESVGQPNRDGFVAQLDQYNWHVRPDGSLSVQDNFASLPANEYVGIGSSLFTDPDKVIGPGVGAGHNGTGYDGMSGRLNASTPAVPGRRHKIYLSLFDMGSGGSDSAVLLDRLRTTNDADCAAGTNRWPVAADDVANTPRGTQVGVNVIANDADDDGDDLSVTSVNPSADHGSVTCSATSCAYTPTPGFVGTDTFTYTMSDGNGGVSSALATVRVNTPPNAVTDAKTAVSGTATTFDVLANDSDPDGHALVVTRSTDGAHGTVSCTAAACTYTSAAGYTGSDSFTYTVSDGHGQTDTGTVNVTVVGNTATAVTLAVSRTMVSWPQQVSITGDVQFGGPVVPGVNVQLSGQTVSGGPFRLIGTATTRADGTVSYIHRPTTRTTYRWKVAGKNVLSTTKAVQVRPGVTVSVSRPTLAVGAKTRIVGKTSPSRKGTPVLLQRWSGKSWVTIQRTTVKRATQTVKPSGAYAFTVVPKSSRVFHYRAVVRADAGRLPAISATRKVVVYDAAITRVSRSADEYVAVKNTGRFKVNIQGWKLTNKKGGAVKLPKRFIKPGKVLRIHTGKGKSNLNNLYLGRRQMFNNSHDRASLVDRSKFRVSRLIY